jgi:hypothetical protein
MTWFVAAETALAQYEAALKETKTEKASEPEATGSR